MAETQVKIASWNVNGLRACCKSGAFLPWLQQSSPDMILLQEVRSETAKIPPELLEYPGYDKYWLAAESRKGYSGVAIFSRQRPLSVLNGMGRPEFDREGRVLTLELPGLIVVSAYFPNSQDGGKRLDYKLAFCAALHEWLSQLEKSGKPLVLGGDFNIAHRPIDLARPEENEDSPGYFPQERDWMESFTGSGWVDSFRQLHPDTVCYSWWSFRTRARERNVGWRIDYQVVPARDRDRIIQADIQTEVLGSDHCPVTLTLDLR